MDDKTKTKYAGPERRGRSVADKIDRLAWHGKRTTASRPMPDPRPDPLPPLEAQVLDLLVNNRETLHREQIAESLGRDITTVSSSVRRLVDSGHLETQPGKRVAPTARGREWVTYWPAAQ